MVLCFLLGLSGDLYCVESHCDCFCFVFPSDFDEISEFKPSYHGESLDLLFNGSRIKRSSLMNIFGPIINACRELHPRSCRDVIIQYGKPVWTIAFSLPWSIPMLAAVMATSTLEKKLIIETTLVNGQMNACFSFLSISPFIWRMSTNRCVTASKFSSTVAQFAHSDQKQIQIGRHRHHSLCSIVWRV